MANCAYKAPDAKAVVVWGAAPVPKTVSPLRLPTKDTTTTQCPQRAEKGGEAPTPPRRGQAPPPKGPSPTPTPQPHTQHQGKLEEREHWPRWANQGPPHPGSHQTKEGKGKGTEAPLRKGGGATAAWDFQRTRPCPAPSGRSPPQGGCRWRAYSSHGNDEHFRPPLEHHSDTAG